MTAALAAFHFLRPLGRDRLGLPCGLKGNGMCFARPLVEKFGYPAASVVEDLELAPHVPAQRGRREICSRGPSVRADGFDEEPGGQPEETLGRRGGLRC